MDSLSKFFDSVIDGTADLRTVNEEASKEEFVPDETELEIERKQEAQRIALAHGGFGSLVDFEAAVLSGHGADYHGKQGYPGMMGGAHMPKKDTKEEKAEEADGKPKDPIHEMLKASKAHEESSQGGKMAATGEGGQVVFEASSQTGQPQTPAPSGTPAAPVSDDQTFVAQPESAQQTAAASSAPEGEGARAKDEL